MAVKKKVIKTAPKKKQIVKTKTVKTKVKPKVKSTNSKSKKKMSEVKKEEPQIEVNLKPFYLESFTLSATSNAEDPNPVPGWMFESAIRVIKLKYPNYLALEKDYHGSVKENLGTKDEDPLMKPLLEWCKENWNKDESILPNGKKIDTRPFEIADIFRLEHQDHKRMLYNIFGVEKIFKHFKFKKTAEEKMTKSRHRWNEKNEPWLHEFEDKYELYSLPITDMFPELKNQRRANELIYCVKMTCTSTQKEHMIYVTREVGEKKDPIAAIASTIQLNITNPEKIYRQGDIVIAKHSKDSKKTTPYSITKQQYVDLMYSET